MQFIKNLKSIKKIGIIFLISLTLSICVIFTLEKFELEKYLKNDTAPSVTKNSLEINNLDENNLSTSDSDLQDDKILFEKNIKNEDPFKTVEVKILSDVCRAGGVYIKCPEDIKKVLNKNALTMYKDFQKEFGLDENYTPLAYSANTEMYMSKIEDKEYFSEVTKIEYYTGGAHGHNTLISNNYKTKQDYLLGENKIQDLESIFGKDIYKKISDKLKLELKDKIVFEEGAQPKKENFNRWYIKDDKLNVYISQYQVASYAFGDYVLTFNVSEL